jgi:LacI family transcriptional regulator
VRSQRRVTISDVASAAGVSISTVSKVLNDRYNVSTETSTKVRAVVEELGYTSSLGASSLRSHRTNVIAVLVTAVEPFSVELLTGISEVVYDTEYELLIYVGGQHRSDTGWERSYVSRLGGTLTDGTILVTPSSADIASSVPIVAVDPHDGGAANVVVSDNLAGARQGTEHLLALGHRRIAYLAGRPGLESSRAREDGFRSAMAEAGVPVDESLVLVGGYWAESSAAPARALLTRPDRPTAVFAANDLSATGFLKVAAELGVRVPDDVSLVGFDNIPASMLTDPPLTTVDQSIKEMGAAAARMLLHLVAPDDQPATPSHVVLPTRLVVRQSTAPPREPTT